MIRAVFQGIPIYWMHIFSIPQAIIKQIESIVSKFLWHGFGNRRRIPLAGLNLISRLVKKGGWGILDFRSFNLALLAVSLQHIFGEQGLWQSIIQKIYICHSHLEEWIRVGATSKSDKSASWRSLGTAIPWLESNLRWAVGNGQTVLVALDAIKGMRSSYSSSAPVIYALKQRGFSKLASIGRGPQAPLSNPTWSHAWEIGLPAHLGAEWETYRANLSQVAISVCYGLDKLGWGGHIMDGRIAAFKVYEYITSGVNFLPHAGLSAHLWTWDVPLKLLCFSWFIIYNRKSSKFCRGLSKVMVFL